MKLIQKKGKNPPKPVAPFGPEDNLHVIAGPAKGKVGKFKEYRPKTDSVLIAGVNMGMKHFKKTQAEDSVAERKLTERPVHVSNVLLICPYCNEPTRIGHKISVVKRDDRDKRQNIRVCKRCGKEIERLPKKRP
jgi:large subunit ribosomal protein L24